MDTAAFKQEAKPAFKQEVQPIISAAITANGGLSSLQTMYRDMPFIQNFISGWVCGVVFDRRKTPLMQVEITTILDMVRLALSSDSTSS